MSVFSIDVIVAFTNLYLFFMTMMYFIYFPLGKTIPYPISNPDGSHSMIQRKDASTCMRSTENGIVDKVMLTTTQGGEVC